jgi:putative ABC transport system permease protein
MTRSPDHPIARFPMFWRLWWRAVSVKRSQAALALGSLVVGAAITSMLLNLYGDVRRKMTEDFRSYGANVAIAPASGGTAGDVEGPGVMEESAIQPVARFATQTVGTIFVPILYGVVRVSPSSADARVPDFANVVAAGADFGALRRMNPGWHDAGEAVSADLPPGACAVGAHLAARMHLRPGDSIDLRRVTEVDARSAIPVSVYRIAAILTTGASEDDQIFLPLATLQSFLGLGGKVTLVELNIPGETRDVESAVRRLAGSLPGLEVRPIRQIVYSEGKVLGTIRWLLLSLTVLILVIIALCVMATMTAIVLERRKDIGVMKALGAADALLMRLFMTESAGLGLVGGALGYGVGALLARGLALRLFGVALNLNMWTLPVVCGLTVALAVIAVQAPVRIVRAIRPSVVLKGE